MKYGGITCQMDVDRHTMEAAEAALGKGWEAFFGYVEKVEKRVAIWWIGCLIAKHIPTKSGTRGLLIEKIFLTISN